MTWPISSVPVYIHISDVVSDIISTVDKRVRFARKILTPPQKKKKIL
jgi:hypothetical protein